MEIKELYLKNFGKFSDCHFYIKDGMHIFYGENEYGKSTIFAFIKAMLFGLERGRGRAALNDDFSRYEPWNNPNFYEGLMRFESGGKLFCLERQFDRYGKKVSLVCETDGEKLSVEQGDLSMLLGEITEESFENVVAVGQLSACPGAGLAEQLQNFAANYYQTASDTVMISKALAVLQERKKETEQKKKAFFQEQKEACRELEQECLYIKRDLEKLRTENEQITKKAAQLSSEQQEKRQESQQETQIQSPQIKEADSVENKKRYAILASILCFVGVVFCVLLRNTGILSFLLPDMLLMMMAILLFAAAAWFFWRFFLLRSKQRSQCEETVFSEQDMENKQSLEADEGIENALKKLRWQAHRIQEEQQERQVRLQNLQEQIEETEQPGQTIQALQFEQKALELAETHMQQAAKELAHDFGKNLNKRASEILEKITNGRYTRLLIDEKLNMEILEQGKRIPVKRLSAGTLEQIYFALRMASAELLYAEPLPLIFDEAFAYYDEKRLKSTLKWLSEQERQVIIFTCQRREQEIAAQM